MAEKSLLIFMENFVDYRYERAEIHHSNEKEEHAQYNVIDNCIMNKDYCHCHDKKAESVCYHLREIQIHSDDFSRINRSDDKNNSEADKGCDCGTLIPYLRNENRIKDKVKRRADRRRHKRANGLFGSNVDTAHKGSETAVYNSHNNKRCINIRYVKLFDTENTDCRSDKEQHSCADYKNQRGITAEDISVEFRNCS